MTTQGDCCVDDEGDADPLPWSIEFACERLREAYEGAYEDEDDVEDADEVDAELETGGEGDDDADAEVDRAAPDAPRCAYCRARVDEGGCWARARRLSVDALDRGDADGAREPLARWCESRGDCSALALLREPGV
ncbi:MAG: hypothetical protein H6713_41815 [Myxococcales bacterium]|nr:hypothetical protein [Myxococcales bacterium]